MNYGVYYIGTGKKYVAEILRSIKQLKKVIPEMKVAVASNIEISDNNIDYFINIEDPFFSFMDKVKYMYKTPFKKTLFMDTDTFVIGDITPLFIMLDRVDICAPYAPNDEEFDEIPNSFMEFNTGVVGYKKNRRVKKTFKLWLNHYSKQEIIDTDIPPDQPSFRYAVYKTNIKFAYISLSYNCMLDYPNLLFDKVSVLHGHYSTEQFNKFEKEVNRTGKIRTWSK